jgi:hypothetical protein
MISTIEKLLEDERKVVERLKDEVTIDYLAVRAEERIELLLELLAKFSK